MFDYWKAQYIDRGFIPGGMFVKGDLCYIPIPKNSSSYVGQLLAKNGWGYSNFLTDDLTNKKIIVLLREPMDRWVAGITQYMCSALLNKGRTVDIIINQWTAITRDLIFDRVIFDDHTEKQVYFINNIPKESCVFFNSASQPELAIKNYLNTQGIDLNIDFIIDKNQTQSDVHKEKLFNFIKTQLTEDPRRINRIKNIYKEDYELWNETISQVSN